MLFNSCLYSAQYVTVNDKTSLLMYLDYYYYFLNHLIFRWIWAFTLKCIRNILKHFKGIFKMCPQ